MRTGLVPLAIGGALALGGCGKPGGRRGWRGDRLDAKGAVEEAASKDSVATFRNLSLGPGIPTGIAGQEAPNYSIAVPNEETARLEDGVVVRLAPRAAPASGLSVKVARDDRRVLPQRPKEKASMLIRTTSVGRIVGADGRGSGFAGESYTVDLGHDPGAEAGTGEVRLGLRFEKPLRSYPFGLPIRLRWPRQTVLGDK